MSKLLINEPPLQVLPSLATWVGLNEAIFLQQLHYWLENPKVSGQMVGQAKWIRNTLNEWGAQMPFLSDAAIRRVITNLEKDGLLLVRDDLNRAAYDQTKWFTLNYAALEALDGPVARVADVVAKRRKARAAASPAPHDTGDTLSGGGDKMSGGGVTKCQGGGDKVSRPIPETTTKTTSETLKKGVGDPTAVTEPEQTPNGDDTDQAGIEQTWGALVVFCGGDAALAATIWRLMDAFREKARMTAVRFDRRGVHAELERSWWPHLREILELSDGNVDTAVRTIEASVKKLDEWDPTAVQAPRSIVNKARAVIAAGERGAPLEGKPKANGRPKAPAVSLPGINDLSQYGRRRRPVLVDTPKGDE